MVEVEVEFDYEAKEPGELTLKKGDIIKDVVQKPGGWWQGVLNDKRGMFPDNFVKIIMDNNKQQPVVLRNKKDVTRIRKCRVIFSYNQDHEDELNLKVGDIIDIIGEEEEGWWRGILNGKEGVFPSNFVEEIQINNTKTKQSGSKEDLTENFDKAPVLPPKAVKQLCEVKYPYKAQNEDELTLKQGDIVTIISKDGQDPGWWKGELNGKIGLFPDNFVAIVKNDDTDDKTSTTVAIKPTNIVTEQRKSLELKNENSNNSEQQKTPPVPGKKPLISLKKSPSNSSTGGGGLFSDLKKKIVDVVDGATGSKPSKTEQQQNNNNNNEISKESSDNVFDQVERRPLLHDVRANRVKAPGRRLPSMIFKDDEEVPNILNGNNSTEEKETPSTDLDGQIPVKPKLREWEKHKAPWLEEMKQNQAKRTSTSPIPPETKLKPQHDETSSVKNPSPSYENVTVLKTPTNELEKTSPMVRTKPIVPAASSKPQISKETPPPTKPKLSPSSKSTNNQTELVTYKQYSDLLSRVQKLEALIVKQNEQHQAALEDLKNKLQLETEMRILMQGELEKITQSAALEI